jgi:uncharacterized membrane protein
MKRLRRYIVAGLLVWIPLGITILLIRIGIGQMDRTLGLIPSRYRPEILLQQLLDTDYPVVIPGLGVILVFVILVVTGVLAANFLGRAFLGGWESLMDRIPVVRSIYSASKNFAEIVFSDSSHAFKRVLLVEYPRKGIYSLAFQTSSELGEVQGRTGAEVVGCFVPTTPNPTSGFIIIVPRKDVTVLDMEVDEALKMIISLGVVVPPWRNGPTPELPFDDNGSETFSERTIDDK